MNMSGIVNTPASCDTVAARFAEGTYGIEVVACSRQTMEPPTACLRMVAQCGSDAPATGADGRMENRADGGGHRKTVVTDVTTRALAPGRAAMSMSRSTRPAGCVDLATPSQRTLVTLGLLAA